MIEFSFPQHGAPDVRGARHLLLIATLSRSPSLRSALFFGWGESNSACLQPTLCPGAAAAHLGGHVDDTLLAVPFFTFMG